MIFDRIDNLGRYSIPMAADITAYMRRVDPSLLVEKEISIKGPELFVRPSEYETHTPIEGKFETHRIYADLQYIVSGAEIIQTAVFDKLDPLGRYDENKDCQFFRAETGISNLLVPLGHFVFLLPGEAHRAGCHVAGLPGRVKKLVFKIKFK